MCEDLRHIVVTKLIELGAHLTKEYLVELCSLAEDNLNFDMLTIFMNNKIFVDIDCFKAYTDATNDNDECYHIHSLDYNKSILDFVSFGLVIDLECVEYALSRGAVIENLDIYNIEYDDKLYDICFKTDIFPDTYMNKFINILGKHKIILRQMFISSDLQKIKKFIELTKLTPDKYCYSYALNHNKNCASIMTYFNYSPVLDDIIDIKSDDNRQQMYNKYYKSIPITLQ